MPGEKLPGPPTREPDFDDDFRHGVEPGRWVAHYLPHWTTPERSRARYEHGRSGLVLKIEHDQPDWRPEDGPLRVSNLQTGNFAGPLGSARGTHRHREDGLRVRTPWAPTECWAPSAGRVDVTVAASTDADCMLAAWLVGTERDDETHAGEVCIFEIDAGSIGSQTTVRTGIKAHHDPTLTTDMAEVRVPLAATSPHTWTAVWGRGETLIGCEGVVVRRVEQAPAYPLFLMIDLFEIGPPSGVYPKTARVLRARGWSDEGSACSTGLGPRG